VIAAPRVRISPKELRAHGWAPLAGRYRCYIHRAGWWLEHCGHPTALWPYLLRDPDGAAHLAPNGRAWPTVAAAVDYVRVQEWRAN